MTKLSAPHKKIREIYPRCHASESEGPESPLVRIIFRVLIKFSMVPCKQTENNPSCFSSTDEIGGRWDLSSFTKFHTLSLSRNRPKKAIHPKFDVHLRKLWMSSESSQTPEPRDQVAPCQLTRELRIWGSIMENSPKSEPWYQPSLTRWQLQVST